jgi:uncharacterized protein YbaR (Trm112 family)
MAHLTAALLAVLRCPVTGSTLVQEGSELVSTAADSAGNHPRYPIEDGIPVLLTTELRTAAAGAGPLGSGTPDAPNA